MVKFQLKTLKILFFTFIKSFVFAHFASALTGPKRGLAVILSVLLMHFTGPVQIMNAIPSFFLSKIANLFNLANRREHEKSS